MKAVPPTIQYAHHAIETKIKPRLFCYTNFMSQQKLIILRGYPGSGKITVGKRLEVDGVGKFIDHNAILTFVAGIAGDDDGIYDQIADLEIGICTKLLKQGKTVVVAQGFSELSSISTYERAASELNVASKVIRLDVSSEELMNRVKSPERKLDFNPTVNDNELARWITENPLQDHAMEKTVRNEKYLDEVINEIVEAVKFKLRSLWRTTLKPVERL